MSSLQQKLTEQLKAAEAMIKHWSDVHRKMQDIKEWRWGIEKALIQRNHYEGRRRYLIKCLNKLQLEEFNRDKT